MRSFFSTYRLLILHLSFWLVFISYRLFDYTRYLSMDMALVYFGVPTLLNILISYLHYFFLLPILFEKKQWVKYSLLLIITLTLFLFLRFWADEYFLLPITPDPSYYETVHLARVISVLWGFVSFIVFTVMIKLAVNWFDLENRRKQLENEKLHAELNYLKSQINPHFLFNTLHNLNYLALNKDDSTSSVIIRLSNIMRYMIYDANEETVSIEQEVQYMKDYIELERIRLNQPFELNMNISDDCKPLKIAPLLLFTCLENAFKHGVSDRQSGCWISVELWREGSKLHYRVRNSKVVQPRSSQASGFGLDNLKKRLALHYPNKHEVEVKESEEEFEIHLIINAK